MAETLIITCWESKHLVGFQGAHGTTTYSYSRCMLCGEGAPPRLPLLCNFRYLGLSLGCMAKRVIVTYSRTPPPLRSR